MNLAAGMKTACIMFSCYVIPDAALIAVKGGKLLAVELCKGIMTV
jgi:hypothetical protein